MINRRLFPQRAKIVRIQETTDKYKTPYKSEAIIYENVPCRISTGISNTKKDNPLIPQNQNEADYKGYFMVDTDIKLGDVVIIDTIKYQCGLPYEPYGATKAYHIEIPLTLWKEA